MVVTVVIGGDMINTGYVARKLNAVFRITSFCGTITMTATLNFAMVRTLLGSMERTNTVVLVSVAKQNLVVVVVVQFISIGVATNVS